MIAGLIRAITGADARWSAGPVNADGSVPQRIYFANHSSNLDAPVIWASLPKRMRVLTRPVAAADYWQAGPIRRWLAQRVFRCVLIDRHHVTRQHNPIEPIDKALADGCSIILFPEGTRATDESAVHQFKPGIWHFARRNPGVELVPVFLENLNRILPKGNALLIPLIAVVHFGSPIRIGDGEDKAAFLERARACVEALNRRATP